MFGRKRIHMFPDFTSAGAKQRAAFATVKRELRGQPNVRFGLRYPATLHISLQGGQVKRFDNPDSAMDFVKNKLDRASTLGPSSSVYCSQLLILNHISQLTTALSPFCSQSYCELGPSFFLIGYFIYRFTFYL